MSAFVLRDLSFPFTCFNSECKIDQADFTHWMSFLTSTLKEKISTNPEALNVNIKRLSPHGIAEKVKMI